ncbi:MAG: hypothetical protein LWW97_04790 [Deltaproteobacteria bacterium]|nr:hypothetical protein [Deltaproteobacteria bacterium]
MPSQSPRTLCEYLQQRNQDVVEIANNLCRISRPIHERQNRPDSNENGIVHVLAVESKSTSSIAGGFRKSPKRGHKNGSRIFGLTVLAQYLPPNNFPPPCSFQIDKSEPSMESILFGHGSSESSDPLNKTGVQSTALFRKKVRQAHLIRITGYFTPTKKTRRISRALSYNVLQLTPLYDIWHRQRNFMCFCKGFCILLYLFI